MTRSCIATCRLLIIFLLAFHAGASGLDKPECIAPARPEGGLDLSCKLAQALIAEAKVSSHPVQLSYIPGGVGALAYNMIVTKRPADPNAIVAFSGGSLLNLVQGRFGAYRADDVRWLAIIAMDIGAIVTARGQSMESITELMRLLKTEPSKTAFGGAGTIGGQDWFKAALLARRAGADFKSVRFVGFEGGGDAMTALRGGHIQVFTGDLSEALPQIEKGVPLRIFAVLSPDRLPGNLARFPTAREQGVDLQWQAVRGFYMGRKVSDAAFNAWTDAFKTAMRLRGFQARIIERGMVPYPMAGAEVAPFVMQTVRDYQHMVDELGLAARHTGRR